MADTTAKSWGIVGGGILGMSVARELALRGERVTLLESAPHLGGLADAWECGSVTWDRHYHVTLLSDTCWREVLTDLELETTMKWVETKTGFYTDSELYSLSNTVEFLKFPPLRLWDKFRLGATIFWASKLKNWRKLEQIPVADWLRKWSGERAFQKMWLPLLRAKLGENYQKTSAAFIWATIARMYAARRTGLKKEMFGYVPGGYHRILQHYTRHLTELGVEVITNAATQRVEREEGVSRVHFENRPALSFDNVILTIPSTTISQVCPQLDDDEHQKLNQVQYQGVICASVLLKRALSPYYVTNITDPDIPFTAVIEMSALVDKEEFDGRHLVYLPKYVDPSDEMFNESDQSIESRFVEGLQRMHADLKREDILAFRISRVRRVVALSTLNYSQGLCPQRTSVEGVYAVNSSHIVNGTLNVNESVKLAKQAVGDLLSVQKRDDAHSTPAEVNHVENDCQPVAGS